MTSIDILNLQKYLSSRQIYREKARDEFISREKSSFDLIHLLNEYIAFVVLYLSGRNLQDIHNGLYIGDLIVSFCRTHFIVIEHVLFSELIEAVTLIRKQIELIARLNELLTCRDANKLIKKTPNVAILREKIRMMYGQYSEISHSSHPGAFQLLGAFEEKDKIWSSVYPMYQENTKIAVHHVAMSVFDFFSWANDFFSDHFEDYDQKINIDWFDNAKEKYFEAFSKKNECVLDGAASVAPLSSNAR